MAGSGVEGDRSVEWPDREVELPMPARLNQPHMEVEFPTREE
jgi:hypothetical protein